MKLRIYINKKFKKDGYPCISVKSYKDTAHYCCIQAYDAWIQQDFTKYPPGGARVYITVENKNFYPTPGNPVNRKVHNFERNCKEIVVSRNRIQQSLSHEELPCIGVVNNTYIDWYSSIYLPKVTITCIEGKVIMTREELQD